MRRNDSRVGMTGGISIGAGVTLFALCAFPPLGFMVGAVLAGVLINHLAQRNHQRKLRAGHNQRIEVFYERGDQQAISQTWSNPGWRA